MLNDDDDNHDDDHDGHDDHTNYNEEMLRRVKNAAAALYLLLPLH